MRQQPQRLKRQKAYGRANQMSFEATEAVERASMKARMEAQRKRNSARSKTPQPNDAMNSGTMGGRFGSSPLRRAYASMARGGSRAR